MTTDNQLTHLKGQQIQGYVLEELIGEGGMGTVYRARQASLDRVVCIKLLSSALSDRPEFRQLFTEEAKILAKLSHPNILTVHDLGFHDGNAYLVMEYVEGKTLSDLVRSRPLSLSEYAGIVLGTTRGVSYIHRHGILHRDLKPANILISKTGKVKIADFGIALQSGSGGAKGSTMSPGTLRYCAPEIVVGRPYDQKADLFSLAITFFVMMTAKYPECGKQPSELNRLITPKVDAVLNRAMSPDARERQESVEEFGIDLIVALLDLPQRPKSLSRCPIPPSELFPEGTGIVGSPDNLTPVPESETPSQPEISTPPKPDSPTGSRPAVKPDPKSGVNSDAKSGIHSTSNVLAMLSKPAPDPKSDPKTGKAAPAAPPSPPKAVTPATLKLDDQVDLKAIIAPRSPNRTLLMAVAGSVLCVLVVGALVWMVTAGGAGSANAGEREIASTAPNNRTTDPAARTPSPFDPTPAAEGTTPRPRFTPPVPVPAGAPATWSYGGVVTNLQDTVMFLASAGGDMAVATAFNNMSVNNGPKPLAVYLITGVSRNSYPTAKAIYRQEVAPQRGFSGVACNSAKGEIYLSIDTGSRADSSVVKMTLSGQLVAGFGEMGVLKPDRRCLGVALAGEKLLLAVDWGEILVLSATTGQSVAQPLKPSVAKTPFLRDVAYDSRRQLVVAGGGGEAYWWDLATGSPAGLQILDPKAQPVASDGIGVDPLTSRALVAVQGEPTLAQIDPSDISRMPLKTNAQSIEDPVDTAVAGADNEFLLVSDLASKRVHYYARGEVGNPRPAAASPTPGANAMSFATPVPASASSASASSESTPAPFSKESLKSAAGPRRTTVVVLFVQPEKAGLGALASIAANPQFKALTGARSLFQATPEQARVVLDDPAIKAEPAIMLVDGFGKQLARFDEKATLDEVLFSMRVAFGE